MKPIIKRVFELTYTKQKLVGIPKDCDIKAGDYVRITKVEENDR